MYPRVLKTTQGLKSHTAQTHPILVVEEPSLSNIPSPLHASPSGVLLLQRLSELLDSPLSPEATSTFLDSRSATLRLIADRLQDIPAQCSFFILKNSQAIPKLTNILRGVPTWEYPESLNKFDLVLREALCGVLNVDLSDDAWSQSSWPISQGGLGVRHAADLALPAFLSSSFGSLELVKKILPPNVFSAGDHSLSRGVLQWTNDVATQAPPLDHRHLQKEWESPIISNAIRKVHEHATSPVSKARLMSVSSSESGAFLQAVPASSLGTLMTDNDFRIAVALRLGAVLSQPHVCRCGTEVVPPGIHGLSCRQSAGRISRHSSVNDILKRAFASAGIPATLEPTHLSLHNNLRPDGVTLVPWREGKSLVWDFTCVDSQAPSYVEFSSEVALHTASLAEDSKRAKYAHLALTHIVTPVAVECLGAIGRESLSFLKDLGKRITAATGESRATSYLLQRLSIAVQRGNAQAIQGSLPTSASLEDFLSVLCY